MARLGRKGCRGLGAGAMHRRITRLGQAARGVVEPLERRMLLSISVIVQTKNDDSGSVTPTFVSGTTYNANTLRDALTFAGTSTATVTVSFSNGLTGTVTLENHF